MALIKEPLALLAVLLSAVAVAELLGRHRWGRSLGGALIVILIGALLANLRIIPPAGGGGPVYDPIFAVVTPAAIFLILLDANLKAIRRAGGVMVAVFLLGSVGTVLGVVTASWLTPARAMLGDSFAALGGMFAATYIGGSANFNAVALHQGVMHEGGVYVAAVVADNVITTVWVLVTVVLPVLLYRTGLFGDPGSRRRAMEPDTPHEAGPPIEGVVGVAIPVALAVIGVAISNAAAEALKQRGLDVPAALIVTTLALMVAQVPAASRLTLAKPVGLVATFLFLAVVGASADVAALVAAGRLGLVLMAFVTILVLVHGATIVLAGYLLKAEPETIAIASNANIGGASSAFALAEALRRDDLVLPGILVGSLGTAIGTYAGFAVVSLLS